MKLQIEKFTFGDSRINDEDFGGWFEVTRDYPAHVASFTSSKGVSFEIFLDSQGFEFTTYDPNGGEDSDGFYIIKSFGNIKTKAGKKQAFNKCVEKMQSMHQGEIVKLAKSLENQH